MPWHRLKYHPDYTHVYVERWGKSLVRVLYYWPDEDALVSLNTTLYGMTKSVDINKNAIDKAMKATEKAGKPIKWIYVKQLRNPNRKLYRNNICLDLQLHLDNAPTGRNRRHIPQYKFNIDWWQRLPQGFKIP